jgi:murein DD-endopeptidase MepM/ murein hydrolase activator NlpD
VHAGDVLGFMGKTGDAEFSPPHLHFEIHPAAFASLGYDGVVAPYPFLVAWRRAQDVPFSAGRVFVPDANGLPRVGAPPPGAVLLRAADVSRTSGLVPGALERALAGPAGESPPRK